MVETIPEQRRRRFEQLALPHLDAAHNLAFWITRNEQDASDVAQEAYLRALRFFDSFRGEDAKFWILAIVRRCAYSWLSRKRSSTMMVSLEVEQEPAAEAAAEPERQLLTRAERDAVTAAVAGLPEEFREILVLRGLEDLSYKEIAQVTQTPIGTVMSRLSRARAMLRETLADDSAEEVRPGG